MKKILLLIFLAGIFKVNAQSKFNIDQIYPIELSHSYVNFSITYMGYAEVRGSFQNFGGSLRYDPDNPSSTSVTLNIDATSIDTNNDWRDKDLQSEGWFGAEQFPTMTFNSKKAEQSGEKLLVTGDLTIKDVTKEITLELAKPLGPIQDIRDDQQVIFTGNYTINRKEFNVLGKRWDQVKAGIAALSNDVNIQFSILGKQIKEKNFSNRFRNPKSPLTKIYSAYEESGVKGAFEQYETLKGEMEMNVNALNGVAYLLLKKGKTKDALKIFERNQKEFPEEANVYDSLGEIYAFMGKLKEAKQHYEKSLALNADNNHAKEVLKHL